MTVIHHKSKTDYLNSLNKKNIQNLDLPKTDLKEAPLKTDSITNETPKTETTAKEIVAPETTAPDISTKPTNKTDKPHTLKSALEGAKDVAKSLINSPPLPIGIPTGASLKTEQLTDTKKINKTDEMKKFKKIEKPAVIFIEGFELFSSGGNGLKEMAENFKDAIHFTWKDKDAIIDKIKKHAENQKVVLVGHSFGADSAVEIAEELNSLKHGFRNVDLMVTLDAVGFNHHVIPVNVKKNLNFFAEGRLPLLHGTAHVARNPDFTNVHNELRNETHMEIDDSRDLQFEIFDEIKKTLGTIDQDIVVDDIVETIEEGKAPINIIIINNEPSEA